MLSAALGLAIAGVAASVLLGEHGVAHLLRLRAERRALGQTAFVLSSSTVSAAIDPGTSSPRASSPQRSSPQPSSSPDANSSYSSASIRSSSSASSWSLISTSHPSW